MSRLSTIVALVALSGLASAGLSACAANNLVLERPTSLAAQNAEPVAGAPAIKRVVGPVTGLACDNRYDLAKGQAEALEKLRARALAHGGDGVTKVRFTQITNTRSPCWHGVEATGLAVVYAR